MVSEMTEIELLKKENKELLAKIDQQTLQIQQLTKQLEYLLKKLYGSSSEKSKISENQLSLFEDPILECEETEEALEEEVGEGSLPRQKKKGRKAELTKNLPIQEIHCELHGDDCLCEACGEPMKAIGKKIIREEVCFIPAKLFKKVYYSHAYKCDCHDDSSHSMRGSA